ncbi:MAG: sialate O-acetylesterase [Oscillospiraceae bacterium]|nr:sialate O-acetylesterase [Oscillospiraceae bacterium]
MRAAAIFSDRMVLQREKPIAVWGDGKDGVRVTVTLAGHSASCIIRDGKWRVTLPPMPAADRLTMTVRSGAVCIRFREIAVGEVWLCGGQSNMEFEIRNALHGKELLSSLTPDCGVRFYYTPKQRMIDADFDRTERASGWNTASPEAAGAWSAVGLFFALKLHQALGVTVGLIGCNWGGTSASAWVPRETLEAHPALRPYLDDYDSAMRGKTDAQHFREYDAYTVFQADWQRRYEQLMQAHPETTWEQAQERLGASQYPGPMGPKNELRPGGLYETMLRRVCPYSLRGFLYYQGESDDHRPETYAVLLEALICRWRSDWGEDTLPFLNVQLPMFRYLHEPDRMHWCLIREAQAAVSRKLRHTALAVTADCGELDNIHPTDKAPVGKRLALLALCHVYGVLPEQDAEAPVFLRSYVCGSTLTVETLHAEDGFVLRGEPAGFELCGADGVWYPAQAVLMPDRILLTAAAVPAPAAARYAWRNYTEVTVFGRNGLPLAPFRTPAL